MADADLESLPELVLLPEGAAFGSYIVHQCIGQGAMGNVYRAEHALLEKPVAIKVMDSSLLTSSDARERFLREGQSAAAIKHPNVVDITDVGVFEGTPYLVMELLEGEDLQIHLQRKPQLSERDVASLLLPIAAALGAAHDRGVVHRDLKPSNIFLASGPDGEIVPKILDFGISKVAHALASTDFQSTPFNQLMGSPLYLPPEAVRGSRDLTAKSDQYSLGVVLYECVTGQPPFAGESLLSILNSIAGGDFARPSALRFDVSEVMERVILRAMNPDPALRYDHVRDLGRDLLEVAGVRAQMLWGRSFGRIDLSEPPTGGPHSTAPMALMRPARDAAGAASGWRKARYVGLAVLALGAVLISSFRGQRAPAEAQPATLARSPETGEAALRPASADVRASDVLARGGILPDTAPASDAAAAPARPPSAPRREPAERARDVRSPPALDNQPETAAVDRQRVMRRARAVLVSEPRPQPSAALGPELRPRAAPSRGLAPEPYPEDIGQLFPPMEGARERASRPSPAPPPTGANEAPILD